MKFTEDPQTNNSSGSLFIKLKDGESIMGILKGEPKVFYIKWENGKSSECSRGAKEAKFRFRLNMIVNEDKQWVSKILEQGAMLYSDLKALNEDYPLDETLVKITRYGTGTDTKYTVLPVPPKQQPNEKELAVIGKIELQSLESKQRPDAGFSPEPAFDGGENIPF